MIMNIMTKGEYPSEVVKAVDNNSKVEGFKANRLPQFTEE